MPVPNFVSQKHKLGIGQIITNWANLETELLKKLARLAGLNNTNAVILLWHMPHKERLTRLRSLVATFIPDKNNKIRKEFESLVVRLEAAYLIRNTVAHSTWGKGSKPETICPIGFSAKATEIKIAENIEFTPTRLEAEATKIARLTADVLHFFDTNTQN